MYLHSYQKYWKSSFDFKSDFQCHIFIISSKILCGVLNNWCVLIIIIRSVAPVHINGNNSGHNDNLLVPVLFGLTSNHGVQVAFDGAKLPNITDLSGQFINSIFVFRCLKDNRYLLRKFLKILFCDLFSFIISLFLK